MARLSVNRATPLIAVAAVLFAVYVGMRVTAPQDPASIRAGELMTAPPGGSLAPDGDTPADTIRTLRAQVDKTNAGYLSVRTELDAVRAENDALKRETKKIRADLGGELDRRLAEERRAAARAGDADIERLQAHVTKLENLLHGADADIPIGGATQDASSEAGYLWLDPLSAGPRAQNASLPLGIDQIAPRGAVQTGTEGETAPQQPRPYFTINNLATLAGSTAFTAIIGRTPVDGRITDPVPFRVLAGRENLAASGLRAPAEIAAMVFEGEAVGDWTLGCATGRLHTATFIFEDGSIRTVSTRRNAGALGFGGGDGSSGAAGAERLGYIADRWGVPCISGKRVSNAGAYLAGQIGLSAAGAAADAAAAAQTSQVIGAGTGAIVDVVDGDIARFVAGRSVAGGLEAAQDYLAQRMSDSFDAVFIEPGREVAILIEKEIAIDYDPNGRKLDHGHFPPGAARPRLD